MPRWEVIYTVNKGSPYEFQSSDGPYPTTQLANERIKDLKRTTNISDIHKKMVPSGVKLMEKLD